MSVNNLQYYKERANGDFVTLAIWDFNNRVFAESTDIDPDTGAQQAFGWGLNHNWRDIADALTEIHTGLALVTQAAEPSGAGASLQNHPGLWVKTFDERLHFKSATSDETIAFLSDLNDLDFQESVKSQVDFTAAEPAAPSVGDRYLNTVTGVGSVTAQAVTIHHIYQWNGTDWTDIVPDQGTMLTDEALGHVLYFNGSVWVDLGSVLAHNDTTGKQGGTTNQYYHFTSAEHAELTNWLDNVVLGAAGSMVLDSFIGLKDDVSLWLNTAGNVGIRFDSGDTHVDFDGNSHFAGYLLLDSTLQVKDNTSLWLNTAGNIGIRYDSANSYIEIDGDTYLDGSSEITGSLDLSVNLDIGGYLDVVGILDVGGASFFADNIEIADDKKLYLGTDEDNWLLSDASNVVGLAANALIVEAPNGFFITKDSVGWANGFFMDTGGFSVWFDNGEIQINNTLIKINAGKDVDTQIQGLTNANLIYADAGLDKVGIGTGTPNEMLTVEGVLSLDEVVDPTLTAGYGKMWVSSVDNRLYFMDSSGNKHSLENGHVKLSFEGTLAPYVQTQAVAYTEVAAFIYEGTDAVTALTVGKIIAWIDIGTGTFDIRIQDVTNVQTICASTLNNNTGEAILDLGAVSNLPTGAAIFQVQMFVSNPARTCYANHLYMTH